ARHAASIEPIRQERIEKVAHVLPTRIFEPSFALQQKFGVLLQIRAVGRHTQSSQPLFNFQIIEKGDKQPQIRVGTLHQLSMRGDRPSGNSQPDARANRYEQMNTAIRKVSPTAHGTISKAAGKRSLNAS